jgi:hypothetical protein
MNSSFQPTWTLPHRAQLRIFRLKWDGRHLLSSVGLDAKEPIYPVQDDKERLRFPHMLEARDEASLLGRTVLKRHPHIVDREDLVFCSVNEQEPGAVWLVESAVLQQREAVRGFALEGFDIIAVAPFVGEDVG